MRKFQLLGAFALTILFGCNSYAQDFSNKGKDFWVGYGYHIQMGAANPPGGSQDMFLYFVTDSASTVTVSCPGTGWSVTYNIPANTVFTTGAIPKSSPDHRLTTEGTSNKGIHVVSTKPIVAYAHIFNSAISGATILYPTNTLGKEYYSVNYKQSSNNANSNCWFYAIATDTGLTRLEITPSANTTGGWLAGNTYTVTLTQGQVYNVMGSLLVNTGGGPYTGVDLTGSKIRSVAVGSSGCKKIAVFSGSGKIHINCSGTPNTSADNYMVQAMPKASWGKTYLTVPTATYGNAGSANPTNNIYRICVDDPTTVVNLNGAPIPYALQGNFYYELPATNIPQYITADKPIMVAQYLPSQGGSNCTAGNGDGDPEVIYLSSVEQNISKVRWNASQRFCINPNKHYINVVIPNTGTAISSFRLDGVAVPASSFIVHPFNNAYSYAILNVSGITVANCNTYTGPYGTSHLIESDSGFNAIAYGYGAPETYGYNAGTNIRDIYQYVTIQNQNATVNFPATCRNTPFYFTMTFPYQPTSIDWNFGALFPPFSMPNPALYFIGTIVVGGKTLYQYQIPTPYNTSAPAGIYPISVTATNPTPDGCGNLQEINYDLQVFDPPTADFTFTNNGCFNDPVAFFDNSNTAGRPIINRYWNFGDLTTSALNNPTHLYTAPGAYLVKYAIITDVGCLSDTGSHVVTVNPLPTASISGTTAVCLNAASPDITFTGANGAAPYTFTYNINGGPNQTVVSVGNTITVSVPTNVAGTFIYNLVSVQNGTVSPCTNLQTGSATVTVNPLPTASIAGTIEVCQNATAPNITFTGAAGTSPYTFTYNINGGPNQTVVSVGNTATVPVPTTTAGTFTYTLISVQDASTTLCSQLQSGTATVTVNPLPTASISGTIAVCVNAPSPDITFTGAAGTAPYTFTYTINGGPNQTVVSVGNTATVSVPTTTAGTFVYALVSVQDATATLCTQLQSGNATVTVNPLPTANIAGTVAVCVNAVSPDITFTGAAGTAPYTFTYTINGGPNQTVVSVGNTATVSVPTTTAGTFTYTLLSVQDASTTFCSQAQSGNAIVTINPLPTASISGDIELCRNDPAPNITFTGGAGTAPYTFTYNINGGPNQTVVSAGNTATVTAPTGVAGTFVYTLISVQDASVTLCSQAQTGAATVIVNPLPVSNFNFSAPSCETRTISFTDLSSPSVGSIVSWTWDFGDGSPTVTINAPASPNVTHTFAAAGTYNVLLTTTNNKGCVSTTPAQQVIIHPRPLAGYIVPEVCLSDTYAQFTDTSQVAGPDAITTWQWNFGDPVSGPLNTSALQNPQHSYTAVGSYNVELIVTSNNGCKDTVTHTLFVNGSFPVANFTVPNPTTLCANDSVAIVEASTVFPGTITKVEIYWDNVGQPGVFDTDNFPVTGKIYKHLYPNFQTPLTQTFTIRYRAYSGGVCVDDTLRTITVNAAPLVQFNNMPNICLDAAPYQITQASETGGVPGTFVYSGPGVNATGLFNPALAGTGIHTILYTFTSATGGCIDTASNTIRVWDTASAQINVQPLLCEKNSISFSSTASTIPAGNGSITGWNWNFGDPASGASNTSTSANPSHTFSGWGNYNVTLFVTTSNGCKSTTRTLQVFVNPEPKPDFSTPASSCLPDASVAFTNTSTIADGTLASATYLWNFDDPGSGANNNSTLANPSHVYTTTGPFNVNLQMTSGVGCVNNITIPLTTVHPQPLASFTTDKIDVCIGSSILFTNTSNAMDGVATQFNWTMDDGNVRNIPVFNYTYSNTGTYNVSLFIFNNHGCRSTTFTKTVFVNPYPPVNAGPDKFMLQGGQVMLTPVLTTGMTVTYLWSPPQYLSNPTIPNTIASPPDDKTYLLTVTTDKGCASTDDVFIKVLKKPAIPNIFSPNGDGVHDTWVIQYLESYPGCTVDIFNRYGQHIYHSDGYAKPWDGTISGKQVPVGTYYYIVNPKNGRSQMSGYVDVIR